MGEVLAGLGWSQWRRRLRRSLNELLNKLVDLFAPDAISAELQATASPRGANVVTRLLPHRLRVCQLTAIIETLKSFIADRQSDIFTLSLCLTELKPEKPQLEVAQTTLLSYTVFSSGLLCFHQARFGKSLSLSFPSFTLLFLSPSLPLSFPFTFLSPSLLSRSPSVPSLPPP